ncbi:MAG TPA: GNAT family N-acetyltransferase [Chloroflexota bacterium]|nr:GNAT family N-acetyltransferase [Chloroflexota bacterium]
MRDGVIAELGDGLRLRHARAEDAEALAAFNGEVHGSPGQPSVSVAAWVRDLLSGEHPTVRPHDFTVVEEVSSGRIVSSLCLISQRLSYGGVELGAGQPELVGTLPHFRRRGLIRRQMEEVHRWSAARGELMTVISGIPWYYRQFGYEMAIHLGAQRVGWRRHVPRLAAGQRESYRLRPATERDLGFISALEHRRGQAQELAVLRDEALWRHELGGHSPQSLARRELHVIEPDAAPEVGPVTPVGFLAHQPVGGLTIQVTAYELVPDAAWLAVTPSVLRFLVAQGEAWERAGRGGGEERRSAGYAFQLADDHPVYRAAPSAFPDRPRPWAAYARVPDLPRFLRHVAPALERRLRASPAAGYSGTLELSTYREGIRLRFDHGRLLDVEPAPDLVWPKAQAYFPDLTFLNLVFGRVSLEELQTVLPDCVVRPEPARVLLEALFPKHGGHVWFVE